MEIYHAVTHRYLFDSKHILSRLDAVSILEHILSYAIYRREEHQVEVLDFLECNLLELVKVQQKATIDHDVE
jgi:tetrahydromethanopterin S-methyltransferase subunit A